MVAVTTQHIIATSGNETLGIKGDGNDLNLLLDKPSGEKGSSVWDDEE